jgi:hypothetical protein
MGRFPSYRCAFVVPGPECDREDVVPTVAAKSLVVSVITPDVVVIDSW